VVELIKSSLTVLNEVLDRRPQVVDVSLDVLSQETNRTSLILCFIILQYSEEHDISPLEQTLITQVTRKMNSETAGMFSHCFLYVKTTTMSL
jgi:hypothetical protein